MIFPEEIPTVMEESEALEKFGNYVEEVFYEANERIKGKGKGKKGKGGRYGSKSYNFDVGVPCSSETAARFN